jgi:hypothetical protein
MYQKTQEPLAATVGGGVEARARRLVEVPTSRARAVCGKQSSQNTAENAMARTFHRRTDYLP